MKDILEELLGEYIELHSSTGNGSYRDAGVLEDYDERWIKLRKDSEDAYYFPIANVRLLKPL